MRNSCENDDEGWIAFTLHRFHWADLGLNVASTYQRKPIENQKTTVHVPVNCWGPSVVVLGAVVVFGVEGTGVGVVSHGFGQVTVGGGRLTIG